MENKNYFKRVKNLRDQLNTLNIGEQKKKRAVRVLITGAVGNIGYALTFQIAQGSMFGPDQPVILHLFDIPPMADALNGLKMEVFDGAFPLVKGIVATTKPEEAFLDLDYAIMCGARPRSKGMERKDLLEINGKIFQEQGKYFEQYASRDVKVLVIGNPANTNCLTLLKNAPSINPKNFTALTRLDHNRMIAQLGEKLKVKDVEKLKNGIIWGNHSSTQFPHIDYAVYEDGDFEVPIVGLVNDRKWVDDEFIKTVQQRGAKIIEARKLSSAASAASAACDHMRDWVNGTKEGTWVSMAVISKGEYGAQKDVVFSFPVTCKNGDWSIVEGLKLSEFAVKKIEETSKELKQEREMALGF
jgi:malate dehydrogenase